MLLVLWFMVLGVGLVARGMKADFFDGRIANWYNATENIERQDEIEAWCKENCPDVWGQLEALGHTTTMQGFGHKQFNYNRDLKP